MLNRLTYTLVGQTTGDTETATTLAEVAAEQGWSISAIKVLIVIAAALLLFGVIRALRSFLPTLQLPRVWRERSERFGPIFELFVWSIFAAVAIAWLLEGNRLATAILLAAGVVLVVVAGFFAIRDYFAGVIIRVERFARVGDRITVDDLEGEVITLGTRFAELQLLNGDLVQLPYSALSRANIVRSQRAGEAPRHTFVVSLPKGLNSARGQQLAYNAVLLNHWAAPRHDPVVRALNTETLEITVQPIVGTRADELEIAVRQALADDV